MKIVKDFSGLVQLKKNLAKLAKESIEYGFFDDIKYPDGDSVAEIAILNEYGSTENPKRPFFEQSRSNLQNDRANPTKPLIKKEVEAAIFGRPGKYLDDIAESLVDGVKEQIVLMDDPPNSPKTIKRKKKNDPLRDTDLMLQSVEHKINRG